MDLITNGEENQTLKPSGTKMNLITAIKTQLCFTCNKNPCRLALSLFRQPKKIGKGKIRKGESEIDLYIPGPHE